ncbi:MAG: DUF4870 domain-containing protein [Verrucomicrobia bacterium CG_4_10_14_3_um_filter_43_23]|nr:MAG: orotate phosphoribosyltransferase [Verrucomicrobia bacterium CG22_combo_CG10-13_8_21_14_all_43_17]PIX58093.1 MAG: DUF4870 domain-containing protein [Verrucomicrobia bacterium CG_4_10_14_3_um_filter_43_23]PIY61188.1 MAG: DUF4870 domain-containing protein [Verrucomicrobia bacterium CG_4_10_14_0_8_um_filter_43_34]PJA43362.1 MAG: DUF4870 domain-containing protein [Verrucomicrobia bacterium CG_4_9_14_3_um_filter_43_20]
MIAHASALLQFFIPVLGGIIGPFIVWVLKRDTSAYVDDQAKEAINFNITIFIYLVISLALVYVLIGYILLPIIFLTWLIFVLIAMINASNGKRYRYPLTIHFIH